MIEFFDNSVFSERGYADEVAAALRYSQAVAVSSGCEVSITVNAAGYQALATRSRARCFTAVRNRGYVGHASGSSDGSALVGTTPTTVNFAPATQIVFDAQAISPTARHRYCK